ncbi:MAG: T9SS type A sorting domain-containing protein [Flavobacteriales bacterium]|jgi:hypothetical protein|nr:T9SS type A sorting domain-containing protein [Flavobacteriales bacterium]
MKKILVTLFILTGTPMLAQSELDFAKEKAYIPQTNYFQTASFQVEDRAFLEVYGTHPNSTVRCYSKPSGGKMLQAGKLDKKGHLLLEFEAGEAPSFVLNEKNPVLGASEGSGFVQYLDRMDFIIQDVLLLKEGEKLHLSFQSLTNNDHTVIYRLISHSPDDGEQLMEAFTPNENEDWDAVDFEIDLKKETTYTFEIYSQGKLRYQRKLYGGDKIKEFEVFPKVTSSVVHLKFIEALTKTNYTLIDIFGNQRLNGRVNEMETQIELGNLTSGTYFLKLDKFPNEVIQIEKI